jgi:conjugal transfer pilus assembly protein TraF
MRLLTFSVLLLLAAACNAESIFNKGTFDGWHFYRDPKPQIPVLPPPPPEPPAEEPQPEPEEPPPPEPVVSVQLPPPPAATPEPAKGPAPGSVAWLRDALPKMLDMAVDQPTTENIRMYAYLQRLAVDKSDLFSTRYENVMQSDPVLNENSIRPSANFLIEHIASRMKNNRVEVAKKVLEQVPLIFFFESSCHYCDQMASILNWSERELGATVLAVSMDGKPLGVNFYTDYKTDQGHSEGLDMPTMPAVYGYYPVDKRWIPVMYGFHDSEDFKIVIIALGYTLGLINEEQYDSTRSADRNMLLEAKLPEQPEIPEEFQDVFKSLLDQNAAPKVLQSIERLTTAPQESKVIATQDGE